VNLVTTRLTGLRAIGQHVGPIRALRHVGLDARRRVRLGSVVGSVLVTDHPEAGQAPVERINRPGSELELAIQLRHLLPCETGESARRLTARIARVRFPKRVGPDVAGAWNRGRWLVVKLTDFCRTHSIEP
jgi:hypothetical protein